MSSLNSRVILSLVPPVLAFTTAAVIIASYNSAVSLHWLPEIFPLLRASSLPYQWTAPALALLLVFRTEASYARFEEGRKAWTKVIAGANDFARQVIANVGCTTDASLKNALLQYIMAFPVVLKVNLLSYLLYSFNFVSIAILSFRRIVELHKDIHWLEEWLSFLFQDLINDDNSFKFGTCESFLFVF